MTATAPGRKCFVVCLMFLYLTGMTFFLSVLIWYVFCYWFHLVVGAIKQEEYHAIVVGSSSSLFVVVVVKVISPRSRSPKRSYQARMRTRERERTS